jgi:hypothetical protein
MQGFGGGVMILKDSHLHFLKSSNSNIEGWIISGLGKSSIAS